MPELAPIILTFGGGLNSRRRPLDIDINECVDGDNFDLDPQLLAFQRRPALDLIATAPNAGEIRGYALLIRQNGTISTLIQAGSNVYEWDQDQTFTLRGTVSASARLRGAREHNFTLDQYVIITDLEKAEVVKKWDGTTFASLAHNLTGTFFAKYCRIHGERAYYANVKNASSDLPHVIVGSQRGNAETLTVTDRPATVLVLTDPFFLVSLDLKPINGLEEAFKTLIVSTDRGRLFAIQGTSAFDFQVEEFYAGSAVSGDEAMVSVGNDVILGSPARIDTLSGTINFGDIQADDLSLPIANRIENTTSWTLGYDRKRQQLYCFPDNQAAVWVFNKRLVDSRLPYSPWSKWTTGLSLNMQPSCVMPLIHPSTFQDVMYFGDATGKIYRTYGSGSRDAGTSIFTASRTSGLIRGLPEGNAFDVEGWILYRKQFEATVTLTFMFAGEGAFDKSLTIHLEDGDSIAVYNGDDDEAAYYNGTSFYGQSFHERLHRQRFGPPGLNAFFQLRVEIQSEGDVDVQEIGLSFRSAKA